MELKLETTRFDRAAVQGINRTFMELKLRLSRLLRLHLHSINRTFMELKQKILGIKPSLEEY